MRGVAIAVGVMVVAALFVGAYVNRSIDEFYSPGQMSGNSQHARARGVFVRSPPVAPAFLQVTDSVRVHVVDAWIERPTRARYRWLFWRREEQDSAYRIVVHFVTSPTDSAVWTRERGGCYGIGDLLVNGERPARSGNMQVEIASTQSRSPVPDTVRLSLVAPNPEHRGVYFGSCPG